MTAREGRNEGVVDARDRRHVPVVTEDDPLVSWDSIVVRSPPLGSGHVATPAVVVDEGRGSRRLMTFEEDVEGPLRLVVESIRG